MLDLENLYLNLFFILIYIRYNYSQRTQIRSNVSKWYPLLTLLLFSTQIS